MSLEEKFTNAQNELLAQRADIDVKLGELAAQYAADVEARVHADDMPPEPPKKVARKKAAA